MDILLPMINICIREGVLSEREKPILNVPV